MSSAIPSHEKPFNAAGESVIVRLGLAVVAETRERDNVSKAARSVRARVELSILAAR